MENIIDKYLNEKKRTVDLVDWNLAGYDKKEVLKEIYICLDRISGNKKLPKPDKDSIEYILPHLRFNAPVGSIK